MSDEWPEALERGVAGAPLEGHDRSGDLAVFVATEQGGLACVIDGLGLPGARRLMDEFDIRSKVGKGVTVTMKKWSPRR